MKMGCWRKVVLFGFVWFLLVVSLGATSIGTRGINVLSSTSKSDEFLKKKEIEKKGFHALNFVSKRRVPNGPDPIHNRKVGTTRLPPR